MNHFVLFPPKREALYPIFSVNRSLAQPAPTGAAPTKTIARSYWASIEHLTMGSF